MRYLGGVGIKVLFCASEAAPFAKTGGLADVAGSLPLALGRLGAEVALFMPRYRGLPEGKKRLSEKVTVYFIENEVYFNRASLYGNEGFDYPDNPKRFAFFSHQVFSLTKEIQFQPDILHVHDWQAALVPVILKTKLNKDPFFKKTKTLLTIHNLAYQGVFPDWWYPELGLDRGLFTIGGFEFYGKINLLKAGILFADALNTVSPNYAREIQTEEYGCGLEGVIKKRAKALRGILNGIDTDVWDPEKDRDIKKRYSIRDPKGKEACKADLQKSRGFKANPAIPVFGIVSRLAQQKGVDLLVDIADTFLSQKAQLVLLGDGDKTLEAAFKAIVKRHPKNASAHLGFNAVEAHRIYAGSDFFLMPSAFEPCGLGQLISLRYGTLPIVRRTGGLADTIVDVAAEPKRGNGFVFEGHNARELLRAIGRAQMLFGDQKRLGGLRTRAMKADFSWGKSAKAYMKFYKEILG